jgi:hypothetical protein
MKLVICPSRLFVIYLLAYLNKHRGDSEYEILVLGLVSIPKELIELGNSYNCQFVSEVEVLRKVYEEVICHSSFQADPFYDLVNRIKYRQMTLYADGLRNGFYANSQVDDKVTRLIYFGFILRDESFDEGISSKLRNIELCVVGMQDIGLIWNKLSSQVFNGVDFQFKSGDLLLVMRYWGKEGTQYTFKELASILDYMSEEVKFAKNYSRVIIKSHPWFNTQLEGMDLKHVFSAGIEVVTWEDIVPSSIDFPELVEPESILWNSINSPDYFFGFDSTLNILIGQLHPRTQILWPTKALYSKLFDMPRSSRIVDDQVSWMQEYLLKITEKNQLDLEIEFNGAAIGISGLNTIIDKYKRLAEINTINFRLERDGLAAERDGLAAERDGLAAERDGLAAERDGLAAERDGLAAVDHLASFETYQVVSGRIEKIARIPELVERSKNSNISRGSIETVFTEMKQINYLEELVFPSYSKYLLIKASAIGKSSS